MVTLGIVGCGGVTRFQQLPAIEAVDGADVAWLCDIDVERAAALAAEHDVDHYGSLDAALGSPPDAVVVATPHHTHADLTVQALEAGCHVLCEKPMADTVAACERMAAAAAETGRKLCIAHTNRFRGPMRAVYEAATGGAYGDVVGAASFVGREVEWDIDRPWIDDLPTGTLGEHLPHGVYLVTDLFGAIDHAAAVGGGDEEITRLNVQLGMDDAVGSVSVMRRTLPIKTVHVFGTEKRAAVDVFNDVAVEWNSRDRSDATVVANTGEDVLAAGRAFGGRLDDATYRLTGDGDLAVPGHTPLVRRFVRSIVEDEPVPVTPEQGTRVVSVLETVRESV